VRRMREAFRVFVRSVELAGRGRIIMIGRYLPGMERERIKSPASLFSQFDSDSNQWLNNQFATGGIY
jgi:hypothetical protein